MHSLDDGHDEVIDRVSLSPTEEMIERQMILIVEGLQIEYAGRANALIDVCSDSRFIVAKRNLYATLGSKRGNEILHNIFNPHNP